MNLQVVYQWFLAQSHKQKMMLASGVFAIIFVTSMALYWLVHSDYQLLFSNLEPQDTARITQKLDEQKVPWKLAQHEQGILVPADQVDRLRMQMMGSNLDLKGHVGFELFDQNDFGMTDFSRKINFQRALQGELERTISALNEIAQARVHLVIPEERLFSKEQNPPQAAVTLKLKHPLTAKQIKSIQNLIATSVPKLSVKHIAIVDQNGNNLIPTDDQSISGHLQMKKETEAYLHQKLSLMLQRILADQPFAVMIDVRLNYDELQHETVQPEHDGKVTHEKETRHAQQDKTKKNQINEDVNIEKEYQFGTRKERYKRSAGNIEHLSISVALPANTSPKTCQRIEKLLRSTSGFDEKRGDDISVEAVIESPPEPSLVPSVPDTVFAPHPQGVLPALALLLLTIIGLCIWLWWHKKKSRERLLAEVRQWLSEGTHVQP